MGAVKSLLDVDLPRAVGDDLGFGVASKPLSIQQLVARTAIEAIDEAVIPRAAEHNESWAYSRVTQLTLAAVNSAALSDRTKANLPRSRISRELGRITSCEHDLAPTSIARHSRVYSWLTYSIFRLGPSTISSWTKS